jgi:hypothetical protein
VSERRRGWRVGRTEEEESVDRNRNEWRGRDGREGGRASRACVPRNERRPATLVSELAAAPSDSCDNNNHHNYHHRRNNNNRNRHNNASDRNHTTTTTTTTITTTNHANHTHSKKRYMVRDALIEADAVWNGRLKKCIDDPADFQLITDCILKDVEVSKNPAMAKAQAIVRDLRKRQLYAFVDE